MAARNLWFTASGAIAAFLVTGSSAMLDVVYTLATRVFDFMGDWDEDGYQELVYGPDAPFGPEIIGTDNAMDYNMLAAWLTIAGYFLDRNRATKPAWGVRADAIKAWLLDDYFPEWIAEDELGPLVPDDLTHCWARGALWFHYLDKWGAFGEFEAVWRARQTTVVADLNATLYERVNGSLIWDHRPANQPNPLGMQPSVYAGDTLLSLVLLAIDGGLDAAILPKLAATVTANIFDGGAVFPGLSDVGGEVVLEGEPIAPNTSGVTTPITAERFVMTGFSALHAWDATGIIASLAAQAASLNGFAMPAWMVFGERMKTLG